MISSTEPAPLPAGEGDPNAEGSASIRATAALFRTPDAAISLGQLASSFLPLVALYGAMSAGLTLGWWAAPLLSVVAAGFVVRIFIIQHDCGHGSFLRTRRANDLVGILCSLVTFTPYAMWRRQHAGHHANWNNLDRRRAGSTFTPTASPSRNTAVSRAGAGSATGWRCIR